MKIQSTSKFHVRATRRYSLFFDCTDNTIRLKHNYSQKFNRRNITAFSPDLFSKSLKLNLYMQRTTPFTLRSSNILATLTARAARPGQSIFINILLLICIIKTFRFYVFMYVTKKELASGKKPSKMALFRPYFRTRSTDFDHLKSTISINFQERKKRTIEIGSFRCTCMYTHSSYPLYWSVYPMFLHSWLWLHWLQTIFSYGVVNVE